MPIYKSGAVNGRRVVRWVVFLWCPVATATSVWLALKGFGQGARRPNVRQHFHPPKHQKPISLDDLSQKDRSRRETIIKEMENIYNAKPTSDTMKVYNHYSKFNDPIASTNAKVQIESIIFGIPLIMESEMADLEVDHYCHAIVLNYNWTMKLKRPDFKLSMPMTTYLTLDNDCEYIKEHKDLYYGRPLLNSWLFSIPRMINGYLGVFLLGVPSGCVL